MYDPKQTALAYVLGQYFEVNRKITSGCAVSNRSLRDVDLHDTLNDIYEHVGIEDSFNVDPKRPLVEQYRIAIKTDIALKYPLIYLPEPAETRQIDMEGDYCLGYFLVGDQHKGMWNFCPTPQQVIDLITRLDVLLQPHALVREIGGNECPTWSKFTISEKLGRLIFVTHRGKYGRNAVFHEHLGRPYLFVSHPDLNNAVDSAIRYQTNGHVRRLHSSLKEARFTFTIHMS